MQSKVIHFHSLNKKKKNMMECEYNKLITLHHYVVILCAAIVSLCLCLNVHHSKK